MFNITWERGSAGWNEPKCNGRIQSGVWDWVKYAERCNELEVLLGKAVQIIHSGSGRGDLPAIIEAVTNPPEHLDG